MQHSTKTTLPTPTLCRTKGSKLSSGRLSANIFSKFLLCCHCFPCLKLGEGWTAEQRKGEFHLYLTFQMNFSTSWASNLEGILWCPVVAVKACDINLISLGLSLTTFFRFIKQNVIKYSYKTRIITYLIITFVKKKDNPKGYTPFFN